MYVFPSDGYLAVEMFRKNPSANVHPVAAASTEEFCGHVLTDVKVQYLSTGHTPGADEFKGQ